MSTQQSSRRFAKLQAPGATQAKRFDDRFYMNAKIYQNLVSTLKGLKDA